MFAFAAKDLRHRDTITGKLGWGGGGGTDERERPKGRLIQQGFHTFQGTRRKNKKKIHGVIWHRLYFVKRRTGDQCFNLGNKLSLESISFSFGTGFDWSLACSGHRKK